MGQTNSVSMRFSPNQSFNLNLNISVETHIMTNPTNKMADLHPFESPLMSFQVLLISILLPMAVTMAVDVVLS